MTVPSVRTAALERALGRQVARRRGVAGPGPGTARAAGAARGAVTPAAELCALCAAPLADRHPHLFDGETGRPVCGCIACALLFEQPGAAGGRYRRVPDRRVVLEGVDHGALGVPVGLAFFVVDDGGAVKAHYPSPAGATRWDVDRARWDEVLAACPALETLQPEVEALLVQAPAAAWILPISDCFGLAGKVRLAWEGMSGGPAVRRAVEEFCAQLPDRTTDPRDTTDTTGAHGVDDTRRSNGAHPHG